MLPPLPSGGTSRAGGAALCGRCPNRSDRPCRRQPWQRALPTAAGPALAGTNHARRRLCMLAAALARGFGRGRSPPCRGPWPQPAAPSSKPGLGWPALLRGWLWLAAPPTHCLRCENASNLSHENLGSDTTVGKPQRIWKEKMKEVKSPSL
ncbi:hypothetical protein B296_00018298 [Ensete ventricosum]|uniref:Uncharacterized protein n=1 Tax=Ensete ventricosum TaxID=4639 RepID=A0A426ZFE0_ENSVE|nr:hypothetical protein B296_00018298 [Ensete ventricosum]